MYLLAGSLLDSIEVYTMVEKGHSIKALDFKRKVKYVEPKSKRMLLQKVLVPCYK